MICEKCGKAMKMIHNADFGNNQGHVAVYVCKECNIAKRERHYYGATAMLLQESK